MQEIIMIQFEEINKDKEKQGASQYI